MIKSRNAILLMTVPIGLATASCGEPVPIDPGAHLVATVWMRKLIDGSNLVVPFINSHFTEANRLWTLECSVGLHARPLEEAFSIVGIDEFERAVQLGQLFYDDENGFNRVWLQRRRVVARHQDHTAQTREGYLGTNFFSTRQVLQRNRAQTAYGVTEIGANASIVIPNDQLGVVRTVAHELGHQFKLEDRPQSDELNKWVMYPHIFETGPEISGWEDRQAPAPTAGSECQRARDYGAEKYYLFYTAIITPPVS